MATTFTSNQVTYSKYAPIAFPDGTPVWRRCTYIMSAAPVINDVFQMLPVFAGERLVNLIFQATDMDTSTGIVMDVGDGSDTDRYIDGSTIGQAGGLAQLFAGIASTEAAGAAAQRVYTAEDTIDVLIQVAPSGTGSAGTITLIGAFVKGV